MSVVSAIVSTPLQSACVVTSPSLRSDRTGSNLPYLAICKFVLLCLQFLKLLPDGLASCSQIRGNIPTLFNF